MPPARRLPRLTPAQERVAAASRRALLHEERRTLDALDAAASRALTTLLAAVALAPAAPEQAKRAALRAVQRGAATLRADVAAAVLRGRGGARRAALSRLAAELDAAARALRLATAPRPPAPSDAAEDAGLADAAGESYAAAWRASVTAAALRWADEPEGALGPRLRAAAVAQDHRLRRIAATDIPQAYNDEHEEACDAVAEEHKGAAWLAALVRYWDASLDRKLCPRCRTMDTRVSVIGAAFPGGLEPGHVHAHCRCTGVLLALTKPALAAEGFAAGLALAP